jgi:hypothetical protein
MTVWCRRCLLIGASCWTSIVVKSVVLIVEKAAACVEIIGAAREGREAHC